MPPHRVPPVAVALALALAAPAGAQEPIVYLADRDAGAHLVRGARSGFADAARLVVRDPDAWRDVWAVLHARRPDAPPPPAIDFSREIVIVAALGARLAGGYAIAIDSVRRAGNEVEAVVRTTVPGARCAAAAFAITQHVDVVRVPRSERAVTFAERRVETC